MRDIHITIARELSTDVITASIIKRGDKIKFQALSNVELNKNDIEYLQRQLGYDQYYGIGLGLKVEKVANKYKYDWYCSGNND